MKSDAGMLIFLGTTLVCFIAGMTYIGTHRHEIIKSQIENELRYDTEVRQIKQDYIKQHPEYAPDSNQAQTNNDDSTDVEEAEDALAVHLFFPSFLP